VLTPAALRQAQGERLKEKAIGKRPGKRGWRAPAEVAF